MSIRENAAMSGDPSGHRASAAALLPTALIAAAVLILALVVSGRDTGTIVVERQLMQLWTRAGGRPIRQDSITTTIFTQTSARGEQLQQVEFGTYGKPGYQAATSGNLLEIFDPRHQTIYATTPEAWERAVRSRAGASTSTAFVQVGLDYSPGRSSIFEQELHRHLYKLAARLTVGGRPALELVPAHSHEIRLDRHSGSYQVIGTVYVSPGTYYPIKEVVPLPPLGHVSQTSVTRWSLYRVLAATRANRWMTSLTLRHPHARIIRSAEAYIAAGERMAIQRRTGG